MPNKKRPTADDRARLLAALQREKREKLDGYRERALAMYPHICARCGREFSGKRLRELTVHHKDHNHMNNPPDGSNWELLCLYCHDDEHQKSAASGYHDASTRDAHTDPTLDYHPFEALGDLLPPDNNPDAPKKD
jgi:hypothetical protein